MNTTTVTHKVNIGLDRNTGNVIAIPSDLKVRKGEKLQISSNKGKFRVVFVPWPFTQASVKDTVDTENELTFKTSGDFTFYCYLTPTGETKERTYPQGGGGHGNVGP
jgi:plastocyanin